jgi:hypothetical protein
MIVRPEPPGRVFLNFFNRIEQVLCQLLRLEFHKVESLLPEDGEVFRAFQASEVASSMRNGSA